MRSRAAACVLLLALWTRPLAAQEHLFELAGGSPTDFIELTSDTLSYAQTDDVLTLEGHVIAERAGSKLWAAKGVLDRKHHTLTLSGGVMLQRGRQVAFADGAVVDLQAHSADLDTAVILLKDRALEQMPKLSERATLRAQGRNTLTLGARTAQQQDNGHVVAHDIRVTPCDCPGTPDYELLAADATLHDDRADLSSVRLSLFGAPIPLFPVSLPLLSRQSGMLQPAFGFSPVAGFGYSQPVFITLGKSYDLTLSPGFFTGAGSATGPALGFRSVKGPRLGLEFRWAPTVDSHGEASVDLIGDLASGDTPAGGSLLLDDPTRGGRGFGGLRGLMHVTHRTETSEGTFAVQANLASDTMVLQDAPVTQLDRYADSLRSDAGFWRARGALTLGAGATLLQDLRIVDGTNPDRRLFGPERPHTPVRSTIFASLAPMMLGPVALAGEASVTQFVTPGGPSHMEFNTGFSPTDRIGAAPAYPLVDPAQEPEGRGRVPVVRFDAAPSISLPLLVGPLRGRLQAGARADAWLSEAQAPSSTRLQPFADASLGLTLGRRFDTVTHTITPSLELRAFPEALTGGTGPFPGDPALGQSGYSLQGVPNGTPLATDAGGGNAPGVIGRLRAYDEVDDAASSKGAVQLSASLAQAVWSNDSSATAPARIASLTLRQDALAWDGLARAARLSEANVVAGLALGPLALSGELRWLWDPLIVTEALGHASLRDARGDELHANLTALRGPAGPRMLAGLDELFSSVRLAAADGDLAGTANAGLVWVIPALHDLLHLGIDSTSYLGPLPADAANWTHRFGLTADTPCHCAGVQLSAEFPFRDLSLLHGPSIRFVLDLKTLGSISSN
ncbi:MAG: LPS-assembly protein LptD [Deltaproteobacteria bacterium]|nr:LPS-assembly protein LptD [Deltaproteobacteria bacterium]